MKGKPPRNEGAKIKNIINITPYNQAPSQSEPLAVVVLKTV